MEGWLGELGEVGVEMGGEGKGREGKGEVDSSGLVWYDMI